MAAASNTTLNITSTLNNTKTVLTDDPAVVAASTEQFIKPIYNANGEISNANSADGQYTPTITNTPDLKDYFFSTDSVDTEKNFKNLKDILNSILDASKVLESTDKDDTNISTDIKYVDPSVITRNVKVDTMEYTVTGDGLFDILMDTATKHIKAQFDANRIRQEDYANAYLEIYKVTLQAALQAWTTSVEYEHKKAEVDLVKAQARLVLIQALSEANKPAHLLAQIKQIESQVKHQDAQTDLVKAQTKQAIYTTEKLTPKQVALTEAQYKNQIKQLDVLEGQISLSTQQAASEKAKELLYYRQREGFDENYKEKILQTMLNAWGVGFSVSSDAFLNDEEGEADKVIPAPMKASQIDKVWAEFVAKDLNKAAKDDITSIYTNTEKSNKYFEEIEGIDTSIDPASE